MTRPARGPLLRRGALGVAGGLGRFSAALARPRPIPSGALDPRRDRYLGAQGDDLDQPWARFLESCTAPVQDHVVAAHRGPAVDPAAIPSLSALADDLNRAGHGAVEDGYGVLADGVTVWVAVRTGMPRVTAAMWDWWFGWHSGEPSRYRLWHPDAHAWAGIRDDRSRTPGLTDRQRYVGNTSYVDEYVGGQLEQLAISFLDPVAAGFAVDAETTVVYGRVGSSELPVTLGYLAHQVRPVPGGAEMRSRFYLNVPEVHPVDRRAARAARARGDGPALAQPLPFGVGFGRDLMEHCGREMNHLARFLPELSAAFG